MDFHREVMPNGVRFFHVPMPGLAECVIHISVECGSLDEGPATNGLSHLVEHMSFKGTKGYPNNRELAFAIEKIGAEVDASTAEHCTHYSISAPKKYFERAVRMLTDICFFPVISKCVAEIEKRIVIQELLDSDDLSWLSHDTMKSLIYGAQSVGLPIAGTPQIVSTFTKSDLIRHRAEYYVGARVVAVAVGAISRARARKALSRLGQLSRGKARQDKIIDSPQHKPKLKCLSLNREKSRIILAFRLPFEIFKAKPQLQLMNFVLAEGEVSRLYQTLREKLGLVYDFGANVETFSTGGFFFVEAETGHENVLPVVQATIKELKHFSRSMIPERELRRARECFWSGLSPSINDPDWIAGYFGEREILKLPLIDPDDLRDIFQRVTRREIFEVGKRLFKPCNANLVVITKNPSRQLKKELLQALTF